MELLRLALFGAADQAAFRQDGRALKLFCREANPAAACDLWVHVKLKFMLTDELPQTPF